MTGFSPVQPEVCGTGRVESPGKVPIPLSSKYTWSFPALGKLRQYNYANGRIEVVNNTQQSFPVRGLD